MKKTCGILIVVGLVIGAALFTGCGDNATNAGGGTDTLRFYIFDTVRHYDTVYHNDTVWIYVYNDTAILSTSANVQSAEAGKTG
jgi:hypothetical protein